VLDTTLRDGAQTTGISLSLEDKIKIALLLDELGVDYIEAGWPASNPKDSEFFRIIKRYGLSHSKIGAFGSTRKKDAKVHEDENVNAIIKADVDVAIIFGKSWSLHVSEVLRVTKEENIDMIYDTLSYLRSHGIEVIFDAEHFYQGFKEDPDYALDVVKTAVEARAHCVVLCDTNGGTTPLEVFEITKYVVSRFNTVIGVHMHNDIGCAVANSLMGVAAGARHVQGTINGIGERTGNADLVQILPTLKYKMGFNVLRNPNGLKMLKEVSKRVYEVLKIKPNPYQPYVGDNAFAHKAGVHVDAVLKNPKTYEHIDPELVGNTRKFVLSDLSGSSSIVAHLKELNINIDKKDPRIRSALAKIKELEHNGYSFDTAPASALLVVLRELGHSSNLATSYNWRVFVDSSGLSVAVVDLGGASAKSITIDAVESMVRAFIEAASRLNTEIAKIRITKVNIEKLYNNMFRATIEASYNGYRWSCQGVSINVFEAVARGVLDSLDYFLTMARLRPDLFNSQNQNILNISSLPMLGVLNHEK